MWRTIILVLLFLPVYGQELKVGRGLDFIVTEKIIKYKNTIVNRPPYLQPTIYLESAPLYPTILGLTREISPQVFIIDINVLVNNPFLEITLLHELVHVRQISSGQLVNLPNGWMWESKFYSFDSPYETRPWEVQASLISLFIDQPWEVK
jgi:hypothetical protein